MAKLNGFGDIYEAFKQAENIYHTDLNTKLLSHELEKLNSTIRLLYQIVRQYMQINNSQATYHDVFGSRTKNLLFSEANKLINAINSTNPTTLGDLVKSISALYNIDIKSNELEAYCDQCFKSKKADIKRYGAIENMVKSLIRELMIITNTTEALISANDLTDEEKIKLEDEEVEQVSSLLNIPLSTWSKWVNYIDQDFDGDIIFHTYHGTKGEEYENVAIIMEHSFGGAYKGKNKFKKYFEHLQLVKTKQDEKLAEDKYRDEFDNTKNLFYVACSRAVKNLKVLYLDDISNIEGGIKTIFKQPLSSDI